MYGSPARKSGVLQQNIALLAVGILSGYFLGYIVIETAQTILSTGVANHHTAHDSSTDRILDQATFSTASAPDELHAVTITGHHSTADQPTATAPTHSTANTAAAGGSHQAAAVATSAITDTHAATTSSTAAVAATRLAADTIHSVITSSGSPYQNFQGRIMYGTYKLVQKMPGGEKLTGFTRILHRTKDDEVVDEIPTFRANPMHPECDQWCEFPVADRPNAVQQWISSIDKDPSLLKGAWVLLLECDYVWMKPLQAPMANDVAAVGYQFHFDYIIPAHAACAHIIKRLCHGCDPATVPASGPAPVLLRFEELRKVTPVWERVTAEIEADAEAKKVLDWVREMYAWDVAILETKVAIRTELSPGSPLIVQPPHDTTFGNASMCHYTWGATYKDAAGKELWKWEKRDYTAPEKALKVPNIPMPPVFTDGLKLQDGMPVSRQLHETLEAMLGQMNKAIDTLPDLSSKRIP